MIYAFLSDSNLKETGMISGRHSNTGIGLGLKSLAKAEGWTIVKYEQVNSSFLFESDIEYAVLDSLYTYYFFEKYSKNQHVIDQAAILKLEHSVALITIKAMLHGFAVDLDYAKKLLGYAENERTLLLQQIRTIADNSAFNPDSPKQVEELLFTKLGYSFEGLEVNESKTVKVNDFNLSILEKNEESYTIASRIKRYRGMGAVQKVCEGILSSTMKQDKDIHTLKLKLNPMSAATGRFSCGGGGKVDDGYAKINAQAIAKPKKSDIMGCELTIEESSDIVAAALNDPYVAVYLRDTKYTVQGMIKKIFVKIVNFVVRRKTISYLLYIQFRIV
jgi:DNA polymerase I-like protein with 3'-5' exonuclease and polymerase domains